MIDTNYQSAPKLFWHDKWMKKFFLWMIPRSVKPNHVTVFRFLTTPIVTLLMFFDHFLVGLMAFLFVAFSDVIDGSLARIRGEITDWGKMYDPLADKMLIGSMIFVIVLRYIDFWTSIVIIILEIAIIFVAWVRKQKGAIIQANVWGKIKMSLQVLGVVILLLSVIFDWGSLLPLASSVLYLAIAFALVSLLTYGI